jgi:hypothetical protein
VAAFEARFPLTAVLRRLLSEGRHPGTPRVGTGDGSFAPVSAVHAARVSTSLAVCCVGGETEKRRLPPTHSDAWPVEVTKLPCTLPALVAWARVVPAAAMAPLVSFSASSCFASSAPPPAPAPAPASASAVVAGVGRSGGGVGVGGAGGTSAPPTTSTLPPVPAPTAPNLAAALAAHLQALPRVGPDRPVLSTDLLHVALQGYAALLGTGALGAPALALGGSAPAPSTTATTTSTAVGVGPGPARGSSGAGFDGCVQLNFTSGECCPMQYFLGHLLSLCVCVAVSACLSLLACPTVMTAQAAVCLPSMWCGCCLVRPWGGVARAPCRPSPALVSQYASTIRCVYHHPPAVPGGAGGGVDVGSGGGGGGEWGDEDDVPPGSDLESFLAASVWLLVRDRAQVTRVRASLPAPLWAWDPCHAMGAAVLGGVERLCAWEAGDILGALAMCGVPVSAVRSWQLMHLLHMHLLHMHLLHMHLFLHTR